MTRRFVATVGFALVLAVAVISASASGQSTATAQGAKSCGKFGGTVLLTYTNPDTIILHVIKGKVNAPTTFTMTPSTVYVRNGQPASFAGIKIGDTGAISATEQLPSGTLLACSVVMTGP